MTGRFVFLGLLTAALALAGCDRGGNPDRIAVINTREILTKCNAGIQASQEMQREFAGRREALRQQEEAILALRQNPALSDAKSGKKDELPRLVNDFTQASQQFNRDLANAENAKFKPVADKVNKALSEYAKAHGIMGVQDRNGFAYIDPSIDITQAIIKKVDESAQ